MSEEKTTVVNSGGSGGWMVAVIILLLVIGGGAYLFLGNGAGESKKLDIEVKIPESTTTTD